MRRLLWVVVVPVLVTLNIMMVSLVFFVPDQLTDTIFSKSAGTPASISFSILPKEKITQEMISNASLQQPQTDTDPVTNKLMQIEDVLVQDVRDLHEFQVLFSDGVLDTIKVDQTTEIKTAQNYHVNEANNIVGVDFVDGNLSDLSSVEDGSKIRIQYTVSQRDKVSPILINSIFIY